MLQIELYCASQYFQEIALPIAEDSGIGGKATTEVNAPFESLVTGKGKDATAGGKGKRKY